jgi:hypothetical protein
MPQPGQIVDQPQAGAQQQSSQEQNNTTSQTSKNSNVVYDFFHQEIAPVGQGFAASTTQNLTFNIVAPNLSNGANPRMYYAGKTLGDVTWTIGGTVGTIGGSGATIVTSPTGVGGIAFSAATAYSGSVAVNSANNFSTDFSRVFSSSGPSTEGAGKAASIEDILKGANESTNGKGIARNFDKSGGFEQTLKDFESLDLDPATVKDIQTKYGPGKVGKLRDGTTVVARPGSSTGGPTLEITVSNSKVYKVRY